MVALRRTRLLPYESSVVLSPLIFVPGALARGVEFDCQNGKKIRVKFSCHAALTPVLEHYPRSTSHDVSGSHCQTCHRFRSPWAGAGS